MRTNDERADTAGKALAEYAFKPEEADVTDLLADLQHYCAKHEINFDNCLKTARGHYDEEKNSSPE